MYFYSPIDQRQVVLRAIWIRGWSSAPRMRGSKQPPDYTKIGSLPSQSLIRPQRHHRKTPLSELADFLAVPDVPLVISAKSYDNTDEIWHFGNIVIVNHLQFIYLGKTIFWDEFWVFFRSVKNIGTSIDHTHNGNIATKYINFLYAKTFRFSPRGNRCSHGERCRVSKPDEHNTSSKQFAQWS